MTDLWRPLQDEIRNWQVAGQIPSFFIRDDDAERPTSKLTTLLEIVADRPLALAVVPARLDPALAETLAPYPAVAVWQHGWAHTNFAPTTEEPCELSNYWPMADMIAALSLGHARLRDVFGDRFLPVLVPPWNRMTPTLIPHLPDVGIIAISLGSGRHRRLVHPRLLAGHAQVDLADWAEAGKFIGTAAAVSKIVSHLSARRLGYRDSREPTGILTHHLQMDGDTATFLRDLFAIFSDIKNIDWIDIADVPRPQKRWATTRFWLRRTFKMNRA